MDRSPGIGRKGDESGIVRVDLEDLEDLEDFDATGPTAAMTIDMISIYHVSIKYLFVSSIFLSSYTIMLSNVTIK